MSNYRCKACGFIYDNKKEKVPFERKRKKYRCPLCGRDKTHFEIADEFTDYEVNKVINSDLTPYNAVVVDKNNPSIERVEGCINCGMCTRTCKLREGMDDNEKFLTCLGCGQCILTCPKKVLQPKNDIYKFFDAKKEGKTCIAYIAPGARVSIGDEFGYKPGTILGTKLVGLLKKLGFKYVFDVTFAADLTIMEESKELLERIKNGKNLPMITSCCPSWVRYCEIYYPELLNNLTTCKSPIAMEGTIVKNYFAKLKNLDPDNIFTVAITPCTAKKWEIKRKNITDTDLVITVRELSDYLNNTRIKFDKIKNCKFDKELGRGSGAGLIFGATGGVLEAALRTANFYETGKPLKKCNIISIRGYNGLKETNVTIGKRTLKVAAVDELKNAIPILEQIKNGTCEYDYIEIMNCRGGCIGGGGQPTYKLPEEAFVKEKRIESLYKRDNELLWKNSYENKNIKKLYTDYLEYPGSEIAHELLHTTYTDRSEEKNIKLKKI